jgi:FdhD protein
MTGTTVDVRLDSPSRGRGIERFFYSTSSCGACGKRSIDSLEVKGTGVGNGPMVTSGMLLQVLEDSRHQQALFTLTGGVHSSGLYTRAGARVELREDVGRHNALDKVIGARLIANCIPLANHILAISGRVGYEIIQKAAVAGIPLIVAVGAPTSLAVNLAAIHGITLAGFARAGTMNVYTHPQRIAI